MKKFVLVTVLSVLIVAGCGKSSSPQPEPSSAANVSPASAPATVREFKMEGDVVSVDKEKKSAVIKHKAIEGFMEAMTMSYPIPESSDIEKMKPGDHIQATVYQNPSDSRFWVGKVEIQK